jgi:hypothetical protein
MTGRRRVFSVGTLAVHLFQLRYPSQMDILKMLAELRQERAQIEEAIVILQRLSLGQGKGRGRPPAWMAAASVRPQEARPASGQQEQG